MRIAAVALVALMGVYGCGGSDESRGPGGPSTRPAPKVTTRPAGAPLDGRALVLERCTRCHPTARVQKAGLDRAGWTKTVAKMIDNGAELNAAEQAAVIDFLAKHKAGEAL